MNYQRTTIFKDYIIHQSASVLDAKMYLDYRFPEHKKQIAKLSHDEKMEWYATRNYQEMVFLGNSPGFLAFWKWHVVILIKIKRFYYRIKNLEIFKHYPHISEIRPKK